jgi:hypothetical protein
MTTRHDPPELPISIAAPRGWAFDPDDGGAPLAVPAEPAAAAPAPAAAAPEPVSAPAAAAPAEPKPTSMADAMWNRDPSTGRFAPKAGDAPPADATPAAAPAAAPAAVKPEAPKPVEAVKPAEPEDITAMPEGLGQKAQERFQKLATTVKEQTAQLEQAREAVSYVQQTFQQHGVQREQFEQAVGFIGAINRGDYQSAERMLLGQLQQLSLLTGRDYSGAVDPLVEFPDLAQRVQGLQMSRDDAIELARYRKTQAVQQSRAQQEQQAQQQRADEDRQFQQAQAAVDAWARQTAATDLDWPLIEARLLPALPKLLQGVPTARWQDVVKTHYEMLKTAAQEFRRPPTSAAPDTSPLRPAGAVSPSAKPSSMFDAMWSRP